MIGWHHLLTIACVGNLAFEVGGWTLVQLQTSNDVQHRETVKSKKGVAP